jgi:hypothetical protein
MVPVRIAEYVTRAKESVMRLLNNFAVNLSFLKENKCLTKDSHIPTSRNLQLVWQTILYG